MFGPDTTFDKDDGKDYFNSMKNESYLWSCGSGPGSYTSCSGIGNTAKFVSTPVKSVFTMLTGSYFGDWDCEDNLLRAALASDSYILTNCWGNIPQWHFHHMALGENIGYCARLKRGNRSIADRFGRIGCTGLRYRVHFVRLSLKEEPNEKESNRTTDSCIRHIKGPEAG